MKIVTADETSVKLFSEVLKETATWLEAIGKPMWKTGNLTVEKLLRNYSLNEMKLCYDNDKLSGVYVLQWNDTLFWPELTGQKSGYLHKLAVCGEYRGKGYGRKLIESAELLCRENNIEWLRLNCGTARTGLRCFYENAGFKLLDRVFIDNRDQVRYEKKLISNLM